MNLLVWDVRVWLISLFFGGSGEHLFEVLRLPIELSFWSCYFFTIFSFNYLSITGLFVGELIGDFIKV